MLIILALLATVAFFMFVIPRLKLGVSTPVGLRSSTKAIMYDLRSALINYQKDIGRFPHIGEKYSESNLNYSQDLILGFTENSNVLVSDKVGHLQKAFPWQGMDEELYKQKWKGPYLETLPENLMKDSFGNPIKYVFFDNKLWLWSAGVDTKFDEWEKIIDKSYSGDDIALAITNKPLLF